MESTSTRAPAVAGMFYPGDARTLQDDVDSMLAAARSAAVAPEAPTTPTAPTAPTAPKALIVPHAGYVYSGAVAASAYALLAPLRQRIRRVVLFGPTHRVPVRGLAVPDARAFASPLGIVPLDLAAIDDARRLPQVRSDAGAHAFEHSLEVQLPFLQTALDDFRLVPFAVGDASGAEVAEVMDRLWGGDETLIVVSSDLSHYHTYADAQRLDGKTTHDVLHLQPLASHEQACGATPINGLIEVARRRHLQPQLLDLRNSGDTAGDKARVVGYAAFAFSAPHD